MKRFLKISGLFCLGFAVLALALDAALGWYTARTNGAHLIGREVYVARSMAARGDDAVRTIYLGDSVARQVFPPGEETDSRLKYLTTNQAISLAGQYYLLEEALATHRNVRQVCLFYTPNAWGNDWDQAYTRDYFCGYFHRPRHVREAFEAKGDRALLLAHAGRALLPNVAALNSSLNIARGEPRRNWVKEAAAGRTVPLPVSGVSQRYLGRMRQLCDSRGVTLRVYPCPVSDTFRYVDEPGIYDAPIVYLPADSFQDDAIHIKRAFVKPVRESLVSELALNDLPPPVPGAGSSDRDARLVSAREAKGDAQPDRQN